jgi:beta-glucosidase
MNGKAKTKKRWICPRNKWICCVAINGSPLSIPWVQEHAAAVIEAWYPGEQGGRALADILYGKVNPSGRLCVSFPYRTDDLPPFDHYEMEEGRTYMYSKNPTLYPFGFGLSYTSCQYSGLRCDDSSHVSVTVRNTGNMAGSEVVQFYLDSAGRSGQPRWRLIGIKRINLAVGEVRNVAYKLTDRSFSLIDCQGKRMIYPGVYTLYAGGSQPDARSQELGAPKPARCSIRTEGEAREIPY